MTRRSMSLLDVLAPPGNNWLKELSRRRSDLPPGVRIVKFGEGDDEPFDDGERTGSKARRRDKIAA